MKISDLIPQGYYCYDLISKDWEYKEDGTPFLRTKLCPFWRSMRGYHEQESGYCIYLQQGDWGRGGLLWDQVKECSVNYGLTEEELVELDEYIKEQSENTSAE